MKQEPVPVFPLGTMMNRREKNLKIGLKCMTAVGKAHH